MAAVAGRLSKQALLRAKTAHHVSKNNLSSWFPKNRTKAVLTALGVGAVTATGVGVTVALNTPVFASELELHPPSYPWPHQGFFTALDYKSVKRGYEVYKQVCAACHSLQYIHYRDMVGVFLTEAEAKAEAASVEVIDGPDDEGNMFKRPGRLADTIPSPYENEEAARNANNGAEPPDLSLIVRAREGHEDYIFSLLTGYCDPPAGYEIGEGQYYNPYFDGGAISMAQALYNEIIEYEDGTPATQSQLAKDVTTFLVWTGEPEFNNRKHFGIKALILVGVFTAVSYWMTRRTFLVSKTKSFMLAKK